MMGGLSFVVFLVLLALMIAVFDDESNEPKPSITSEIYENSKFGRWTINEYVNDFEELTGEKYLLQESENGSFSNSATTNSKLTGEILIDKEDIRIMLKEYGKYYVKDEELISFKVKGKNDSVIDLGDYNFIDNQGYIDINKSEQLLNILLKGGVVKFYGRRNGGRSTYNFTISGDHLKEALDEIGVSPQNFTKKSNR